MTTRSLLVSALAAASLFTAACEKAGNKSSGALGGDDVALLKQIPGDNVALFGGNYMKMQDFMNTSFGKGMEDLTKAGAAAAGTEFKGDLHAYFSCFSSIKTMRMVAGLGLDNGMTMHMALSGITLQQIKDCADKSQQKATLDPDGKFLTIDAYAPGGNMPSAIGYLQVAGGALTMRMTMGLPGLGGIPKVAVASRADLEADTAAAAKKSAADDSALVSQLGKLDRSKTVWFAGSGKGTPLATKLGDVSGTMDFGNGLTIDTTVQLTDSKLVKQVDEGMAQLKQMKDQIPPDFRSILDALKYDKSGDTVHFALAVNDEQLGKLMKQMSGMAGMGMH